MRTAALKPRSSGKLELMPMIGTSTDLSCLISLLAMSKEMTITASTLRRTGSMSKNSRRSSVLDIW